MVRLGWLTRLRWTKRKVIKFVMGTITGLCVFKNNAHADNSTSFRAFTDTKVTNKLEDLKPKHSFFRRSITSTQHTYVSSNTEFFREGATSEMSSFDFRLTTHPESSGSGAIDTEIRFNANEDAVYFRSFEAYGKFNIGRGKKLFLGRKKMPWSRSDRLWKRGVFEPRNMDDRLEAKFSGLLGAFVTQSKGQTVLTAFATPFYVPEFGPQQRLENRKFVSRNPWFRPPTENIQLENGISEVNYSLETPDTVDTLTQVAGGLGLSQGLGKGFFLESSYLYKPMNQLALGFPFVVVLGDDDEPSSVDVEINPRVVYHHLSNITLGRQLDSGTAFYTEAIFEQPVDETPPSSWISKQNKRATILNFTYEQNLSRLGALDPNRKAWISFSSLQGGDADDLGEFSSNVSLFDRRYQFQRSIQVGWQGRVLRVGGVVFNNLTRAIYDWRQNGYVFSSENNFLFSKAWSALLKAEFLGNTNLDGDIQNGFTSRFRSNDRVSAGVRYVF